MATSPHLYQDPSANVSLVTTQMNGLGIGARSAPVAIDHTIAGDATNGGKLFGHFQLVVTFGTAPTAGKVVTMYAMPSADQGTTYPDGSDTVAPQGQLQIGFFEVRAVTTAQKLSCPSRAIPAGKFNLLVSNDTDQAFAASGNVLSVSYFTTENS